MHVDGHVLHEGDLIAIDTTTGAITLEDVPLVTPKVDPRFDRVLGGCDELRTLGMRANADTPEDARRARGFGAEGFGLCRTEHVFMAADRMPQLQTMIMADDEAGRRAVLDRTAPLQQADFEGMFEAMEGVPVTIRLLAPPLHEFVPDRFELVEQITAARLAEAPELGRLERLRALEEGNAMLGTRRGPAGARAPGDQRDAAPGDLQRYARRSRAHRPRAARRDYDPARSLRPRARASASLCCVLVSRRASRSIASSASA